MERDRVSQSPDWQSPNLNSLRRQPDLKHRQNSFAAYTNCCANMVIPNDTMPTNKPNGWFYGLPQFRRAFTPMPNPIFKEKLIEGSLANCHAPNIPDSGYDCAKRSFLVFDQTGDQTTLIFSSGIGAPIKFPISSSPKQLAANNIIGNKPGPLSEPINKPDHILMDELNEESEMHEDTEELNALLYSDDDDDDVDYSDDDEVTSKDHTPSTLTFHDNQELLDRCIEHVASSDEPRSHVPSLTNTPCSVKRKWSRSFDYDEDAQSSCPSQKHLCSDEMGSLSNNEMIKREKIKETVSILQHIIPSTKGKTATDVLDEAISYLKSLKLKVKRLGLDTL